MRKGEFYMSIDQMVESQLRGTVLIGKGAKSPLEVLLSHSGEVSPKMAGEATRELVAHYEQEVLLPIRKGNPQYSDNDYNHLAVSYEKWKGKFEAWRHKIGTLQGRSSSGMSYRDLFESCVHDTGVFLSLAHSAFDREFIEGFPEVKPLLRGFIDADIFWLPTLTLERFARHTLSQVRQEPFSPEVSLRKMDVFFQKSTNAVERLAAFADGNPEVLLHWTPRPVMNLKLKGTMPLLLGDSVEFESALLNQGRNAQKLIKNIDKDRITLAAGNQENEFVTRFEDTLGGFPDDLLESPVYVTNLKGKQVATQQAFLRKMKRGDRAGSGLGLDIVRTIVEDEFGGKVKAWNSDKVPRGAIVESRFPLYSTKNNLTF